VRSFVIVGASRGLGSGLAEALPEPNDQLIMVSRTRPAALDLQDGVKRKWLELDIINPDWADKLANTVGSTPVDMLVYVAGIWESSDDPTGVKAEEIYNILAVNTAGFISAAQSLAPNLKLAKRGIVSVIGSTAGLENASGPCVAYAASKFGVRGATHALRDFFRPSGVMVTCLSLGRIATDVPFNQGIEEVVRRYDGHSIPIEDIRNILRLLLTLSPATCIKEIDVPAQRDEEV
jgi:short-subunit dehydrogenase